MAQWSVFLCLCVNMPSLEIKTWKDGHLLRQFIVSISLFLLQCICDCDSDSHLFSVAFITRWPILYMTLTFELGPFLYSIINNPQIKMVFSVGQATLLFLCFSIYFAQACKTFIMELRAVQVVVFLGFFGFSS